MRLTTRLSAPIAAMVLVLSAGHLVAAQDVSTPTPSSDDAFNFGSIAGIQEAVARNYIIDFSPVIEALGTPDADGAFNEFPDLEGVYSLNGTIARFDTTASAIAAVDAVDVEVGRMLERDPGLPEFSDLDVDIGDRSKGYTATDEFDDGQHVDIVVVIAQRDAFVYLTFSSVIDAGALGVATEFTRALMDNVAGDGDVTFDEDGTSTGGLWDKFPDPDDALVRSLKTSDAQVYAAMDGDATPRP